jgi:hypothetical protein
MSKLPSRTALAAALTLALCASAATSAATSASAAAARIAAAEPSLATIEAARANPSQIILRAGAFDPVAAQLDLSQTGAAADTASAYAIVQFRAGSSKAARAALSSRGVTFLGYVPNNAYYVRLDSVGLKELQADAAVRWAGYLQPGMKLAPSLWAGERSESSAKQADGRYEIIVHAFAGVSSAGIEAALRKAVPDVEIPLRSERADAMPYVRAKVGAAELDTLLRAASAIDGVSFVLPWGETTTMNSGGIAALQGNFTGSCAGSGAVCGPAPMFDHGLTGSGQIVAIADSGTTPNAAWFATLDKGNGPHTEITFSDNPPPVLPNVGTLHPDNKILAYWLQPGGPTDYDFTSGHGTHTSGTLVGDAAGTFGASSFMPSTPLLPNHDLADGMAPNAQLIMQDMGPNDPTQIIPADVDGTLEQAAAGGAFVHSDSWGDRTSVGQYLGNDADIDRATRKIEDLLVIIAAGNDVAGAHAVSSPSNAKNGISVAALGHAGSLAKASYSNLGPTTDGRQKPDLAAPGSSTISAKNGTSVTNVITAPVTIADSGTSMATPTVAGNTLLLRQFFTDGFYPRGEKTAADLFTPSGAVMKAVLLNGTTATTSPSAFPNTGTGWGRAWLDGNLWFKDTMPGGDDSRRLRVFERTNQSGLETGDSNEYTIANVGVGVEFRVTLTWFDPPALAGSASTLINNLDLEVVGPDGQTYLGNHFTANVSTPGGTADAKDTVEQVRFTAPVAGSYTLRVKGTDVPGDGSFGSDRQGYALVASGSFGLPDQAALPAPTALTTSSNDSSGVSIGFTGASGAQGYQLYRADGTCATAHTGDFHLVGQGAASPLTDIRTQGGFNYAYKVRGIANDVEGEASACVDVVSADNCTLLPTFDAQSIAVDAANANCSVDVSWSAAQASCPTSSAITYKLERDTDPYFGNPQILSSTLTTPAYSDTAVSNGTPYYYRVTPSDSFGNTTGVSHIVNATPSGAQGPDPAAFLDNADTHAYMIGQTPWQVTNTAASDGSLSYHAGPDAQPYPDLTCATLQMPPLTIAADATTLSFKAKYDLEYQWDGVVMEVSTDGGSHWNDLPPVGGYPDTFAQTTNPPVNACGYVSTHGAFTGVSTTASNADSHNGTAAAVFKPFTTDLSSYVGQTVQLRWVFSSDPTTGFDGFFLDEVKLGEPASADVIFQSGFETDAGSDYMCH